MAKKIDTKIIGCEIAKNEPGKTSVETALTNDELPSRPEHLVGTTYKIKTPLSEHAMYITINDIVTNPGTDNEQIRPYEIFFNSKEVTHFQWMVALTRVISSIFRKGGDLAFLPEELQSVYDPKGGYWKKSKYIISLVAEIGDVVEEHLRKLGFIKDEELDEHQKKLIAEKKEQYQKQHTSTSPTP